MSNRWPGGLIRKTPVTPAGPFQNGAAPGMWTLAEAAFWTKQGLWPIAGNFLAVEDVFSTWLYTGNGGTQTITNGIDLAGKGGMVWIKSRVGGTSNFLFDTTRGVNVEINSNTTDANVTLANSVTAFNSNGFAVGSASGINGNGDTYVSWAFREAPNFFDVVAYTGNGVSGRQIAHNLGSTPGCIIIKATSVGGTPAGWVAPANWWVFHRGLASPSNFSLRLNTTAAQNNSGGLEATSTTFTVYGSSTDSVLADNVSGVQYVAYLFAHNTASDGIIQCGSFTTNASGRSTPINLGWEPQLVLYKAANVTSAWYIFDQMRGFFADQNGRELRPNSANDEQSSDQLFVNATGFQMGTPAGTGGGEANATYIYVAIRRGPMRTPTLGTSVFSPVARTGTGVNTTVTAGFPIDLSIIKDRIATETYNWTDRLRGVSAGWISSASSGSEQTNNLNILGLDSNTAVRVGTDFRVNGSGDTYANYFFRRAPGFMDVVCYTGTGVTRTVAHNLGVAPELMIVKRRNDIGDWVVYVAPLGATKNLYLQAADGVFTNPFWNDTNPTASVFTLGGGFNATNGSGNTYVAYLFASVPGVSKVGTYTGNGSSQTINCAFTTGARYVLIKRTDSTGDWYVWDSARGIVAGNDPYLALNTTAAEVTSDDSVDTDNTGFIVNQVAASNINVNAATYIFLAIA
jgi:hypothetical protein